MLGIRKVLGFYIVGVCILSLSCISEPSTPPWASISFESLGLSRFMVQDLYTKIMGCRLELRELNRAIDKVTPQTPPDKWQSIIDDFAELKATYPKLHDRLRESNKIFMGKDDNIVEVLDIMQKDLKDTKKMIGNLSLRIQRTKERYAVDRRKYKEQKKKYSEHLIKCLKETGVAEKLIYADSKAVVCVDSVAMMSEKIIVIVGAYLTEPPKQKAPTGRDAWLKHMGRPADEVERRIFAYGMNGESLGSPIQAKYGYFTMVSGQVVSLEYEGTLKAGSGSLRLVIEQTAFNSETDIEFEIPYDEITIASDTITVADQIMDSPVDNAMDRLPNRLEVIQCLRDGNHLMVPTELNIHGMKIKTDMLLDTGASFTVISKQLYFKGQPIPFEKLQKQKIMTANGQIECPIDVLEVSTTAFRRKVNVAIINDSVPLLGANYFVDNVFTVDLENQCIYIHPQSSPSRL